MNIYRTLLEIDECMTSIGINNIFMYIIFQIRKLVTRNRFIQLMKTLDKEKNPALINVLWIVLDGDRSDALGMFLSVGLAIFIFLLSIAR